MKHHDAGLVVMKAFVNACSHLGIGQEKMAKIIGVNRTTLNRNMNKGWDENTKTYEIQLLFIRAYRSLFAVLGGNQEAMKQWLASYNNYLRGKPLDMVERVDGISMINMYLDAMRGKV